MCYGSALNLTTRSKAFGLALLYCVTVQKMLQPLFVFLPNVAKTPSRNYKSRLANCCRNVLYVPEHFRSEKQLIPSRTVRTETSHTDTHKKKIFFFIRAICPSNPPFSLLSPSAATEATSLPRSNRGLIRRRLNNRRPRKEKKQEHTLFNDLRPGEKLPKNYT